jgi:hypothetical protein
MPMQLIPLLAVRPQCWQRTFSAEPLSAEEPAPSPALFEA